MKEISKEGWGRCSEQSSSARWHWRGQLREAAVTTHLKTREGGCSMQRNRRCKRRGALWHHRALLPLAAGLDLDDHFLRPYLPHLCAAVGTERLPGACLHGQVVLDGGAGAGGAQALSCPGPQMPSRAWRKYGWPHPCGTGVAPCGVQTPSSSLPGRWRYR